MSRTDDAQPQVRQAVWDLPTRLFHWSLAALIGLSWWSAEEEELELHLYSGYAVLTLVLFRLLWGLFGSSTARFSNFIRGPAAVLAYMRDMKGWRAIGHSPIGALSVVALLGLTIAQVATGLLNSDNDGEVEGPLAPLVSYDIAEAAHDVHELVFNVLLVFIAIHVAAIVFYRLFLGKKLVGPMITGRAVIDPDTAPMKPGRGWVAVICLLVALAITRWIIAGAPPFGVDTLPPGGHIARMLIRTEQTPNPSTRKFLPDQVVMEAGTRDFPDADTAKASPLATALFDSGMVEGVFFGRDFISVTAEPGVSWTDLEPLVVETLLDHFVSGAPLFTPGNAAGIHVDGGDAGFDDDPADADIIDQIKDLIETRVRPAVAQDGGDIVYRGYKDGRLYLAMQGACAGCPSSTITLKRGIEGLIKHYVPEVESVEAI